MATINSVKSKSTRKLTSKGNPPTITPVVATVTAKKIKVLFFLPNNQSIRENHLQNLLSQIPKAKQKRPLYLIIHSIGGNPFISVRIMRALTDVFSEIRVIIPEKAYSAATLMSFGGQAIFMSINARLSPLDLPIEHPIEGIRISSLDVINAATTISSFVEEIALRRYTELRKDEHDSAEPGYEIKNRVDAANIAYKYATELVVPILSKIDPYQVQKSYRELRIGRWYAYDLLIKGLLKGNSKRASKTSKDITTIFPAHEYDIFRDDARSMLGLPVQDLESLPEWIRIEPYFRSILRIGDTIVYKEI